MTLMTQNSPNSYSKFPKIEETPSPGVNFDSDEKENYHEGKRSNKVPYLKFGDIQGRSPFNPRKDILFNQPDYDHSHLNFAKDTKESFVLKVDADT